MKKIDKLLKEAGCLQVNQPVWTPEHPHMKGVVVAEFKNILGKPEHRLIRFGNWAYSHADSLAARDAYFNTNYREIRQGKRAAAYWGWWFLWSIGTMPWKPGDPRPSGIMEKGGVKV